MSGRRLLQHTLPGMLALSLLAGCPGGDGGDGPVEPQASGAADATIARASSPEERRALEEARAEIDAEGRREVAARESEIARLRRENEELRRRLK